MSRRPDGKRGRRKPDPAEETASWLLEVEQAGQQPADDEDDWAGTLRATRREATGQFPGVPPQGGDRGEAPPPSAPRRQDASRGSVGGDTGGWGGAPAPREPEPWDTQAGSESWNGRWPFEETNQSWEPDGSSYPWPAQELPSNTGSWDIADRQGPWGPGQPGQGSYEPGPDAGGYPPPNPYESSRGYWAPPSYEPTGYEPTGYEQPRGGGYPAGSPPTEGGYEPAARYGQTDGGYEQRPPGQSTGEQPLARPYVDQGGYGARDAYGGSNGYGPPAQGGYASPDYAQPEQGYAPEPGYGQNQAYGSPEPGYGQADPSYPSDPGLAPSNGFPSTTGDYSTGEFRTGEFGTGEFGTGGYGTAAEDPSASGYPPRGTYPPPSGRFGPESGYRADAGYPPGAPYEPSADTYPRAGGYDNGYNSSDPYAIGEPFTPNGSSDPYGTGGEPFQIRDPYATGNQPQAPAGASGATATGATGAKAPGIAGQPPRPESWPAQTGSWQADEPVRPRGAGVSGEFSRVREDDEQVVRLGSIAEVGARGAGRPDLGVRPRGPGEGARPVDADGGHISARARWPRVIALISWIILLMVLCWFYVFPFLERILPENF